MTPEKVEFRASKTLHAEMKGLSNSGIFRAPTVKSLEIKFEEIVQTPSGESLSPDRNSLDQTPQIKINPDDIVQAKAEGETFFIINVNESDDEESKSCISRTSTQSFENKNVKIEEPVSSFPKDSFSSSFYNHNTRSNSHKVLKTVSNNLEKTEKSKRNIVRRRTVTKSTAQILEECYEQDSPLGCSDSSLKEKVLKKSFSNSQNSPKQKRVKIFGSSRLDKRRGLYEADELLEENDTEFLFPLKQEAEVGMRNVEARETVNYVSSSKLAEALSLSFGFSIEFVAEIIKEYREDLPTIRKALMRQAINDFLR